jgi:hypothetical protein
MENPLRLLLRDDDSAAATARRQALAFLGVLCATCWMSVLDHGTARAHAVGHQPPIVHGHIATR